MSKKANSNPPSLYLIGIKGMGMSTVAILARKLGYLVAGSDVPETFSLKNQQLFKELAIKVYEGFAAEHLKEGANGSKPSAVVVSAAYGQENAEVKAAKSLKIPIKTLSEMLGQLMVNYEGIGVAGVHGKTTTSALLAYVLKQAGLSPSYAIGAPDIEALGGSADIGEGKYFVAEADEYKKSETSNEPKFLDLPLKHIIITNIELDHPDVYATAEDVYQAFYRLSIKIPRDGTLIAGVDSPLVRRLVQRRVDRVCLTYGYSSAAQFQVVNFRQTDRTTFTIKTDDRLIGPIETQLLGEHNALNATAVVIMALQLGISQNKIIDAIRQFPGVKRRFEFLGSYNGAQIFDDYAHHPTAITYLIEAARRRFPDKEIVIVFQPHTYSRTAKLADEFAKSLAVADQVLLLNIFASAREKSGYVTIKDLYDKVKSIKKDLEYRSTLADAASYLRGIADEDKVIFLVGAGDVYKIYSQIIGDDQRSA